jgi:hypothetical protein
MEVATGIIIPVKPDYVLSPDVFYGDKLTGIYFETDDEQYGRITFDNLDAIKICRGENLPFTEADQNEDQEIPWVYQIQNSKWLKGRFDYENRNYGDSYEFGGDVMEMLTDFSHYLFQFHDEFVEVIARGFWFEKDFESLFRKDFQKGHPLLPLSEVNTSTLCSFGITYKAIFNPISIEQLVENTRYCQQKLIEFALEHKGEFSVSQTLILKRRHGKLISLLRGVFGKPVFVKEGVAILEDVKPLLEEYISGVAARRKGLRK